jgi:hypothetical protein
VEVGNAPKSSVTITKFCPEPVEGGAAGTNPHEERKQIEKNKRKKFFIKIVQAMSCSVVE